MLPVMYREIRDTSLQAWTAASVIFISGSNLKGNCTPISSIIYQNT